MRNKGKQSRSVLTVNGSVKMVRRWWYGVGVGSVVPMEAVLDSQQATVSIGVREMACRLNNDGTSFDSTAQNLQRTALVKMSGEQLRQIVLAAGATVLQAQQDNVVPTSFRAAECIVDPSLPKEQQTTRIYTGLDGVMVPLVTDSEKIKRREAIKLKRQRSGKKCRPLPPRRKGSDLAFKEFKTIVFYDERGEHWHELLSARSRTQVGAVVRREAKRPGFAFAHEKIANVDGASWIRTQLTDHADQLPLDGLGLDFYHLAENVHRCRRVVFGTDDKAGQDWAARLLHTLKHDGWETAWDQLTQWRSTLKGKVKKAAADRLLNYVSDRRDMINYPEFQQKSWQIGSGPTQSRCKTSTQRLKGRGRRWNKSNAEALAALTTLNDSNQWNLFWPNPSPTKT
jgi:hypothetical protein